MSNQHILSLTDQQIDDLLKAIEDAQGELCCGPGFPEANAINARWEALAGYLDSYR